jgi:hypothetical protein
VVVFYQVAILLLVAIILLRGAWAVLQRVRGEPVGRRVWAGIALTGLAILVGCGWISFVSLIVNAEQGMVFGLITLPSILLLLALLSAIWLVFSGGHTDS